MRIPVCCLVCIFLCLFTSVSLVVDFSTQAYAKDKKEEEEELSEEELERKAEEAAEREERRREQMLKNLGSHNEGSVETSIYNLEILGEEMVPELVEIIRDKDEDDRLRYNVIYTLGRLGKNAKSAVPALVPYLRDKEADYRAVTAIALGKIGRRAKDAVPALTQLLYDENAWVSKSAMEALRRIGTGKAKEAVASYLKEQESKSKK